MPQKFNLAEDLRKGMIPNLITLSGMILLIPVFMLLNYHGFLIASLVAYVLGWIMDGLDGWWARKFKMTSVSGAFFDQGADKVNTWAHIPFFSFMLSLMIADADITITLFNIVGVIIFTIGVLLVGIRIYMLNNQHRIKKGKSISAVPVGKIKTNIERGAICLLILVQIYTKYYKADELTRGTIYFCIFALFISIIFASMSLYEQFSKIKFEKISK